LQRITLHAAHLAGASRRLDSLSPLAVLRRGYAVLTRLEDGKLVKDIGQAPIGTQLRARLAKGTLDVEVQKLFSEDV
jgi:exodeoxyribonuclease VII large subunit